VLVLVNPAAGGGRGLARWRRVEPLLRAEGLRFEAVLAPSAAAAREAALGAIAAGERTLVAAGGDGTVRLVLEAILAAGAGGASGVRLGAIGLGSSNDFHKSPDPSRRVGPGVPVRLDEGRARLFDAGRARVGEASAPEHFLLGASVGLIAEGNHFFNVGDPALRALKRVHTEVAILYAVIASLARHRPLAVGLGLDGGAPREIAVAAIQVMKRPTLAGGMRFDGPGARAVEPDDGRFDVCVFERMPRAAILATVLAAYRGRLRGSRRARFFRAQEVELALARPAPVELDGEVRLASRAVFDVLPRAILVCGGS
jgi:diacylglycerol kinase family enzyme